jgi:uncharacterized repeat protein (TIGR01451 family)
MPRRRRPLLALLALVPVLAGLPALTPLAPPPAAAAGTADLAVTMAGDAKRLKFGETITFTITVANLGPDVATGVVLGFGTSDSYQNFGVTCPDGSVFTFCDLRSLAPGAGIAVLARAMASSASCCPDRRLGVAGASVSHDADTVDPVAGNDSVRVETKLVGKAPG